VHIYEHESLKGTTTRSLDSTGKKNHATKVFHLKSHRYVISNHKGSTGHGTRYHVAAQHNEAAAQHHDGATQHHEVAAHGIDNVWGTA